MYKRSCYKCKFCSCTYFGCFDVVSIIILMLFCIKYLITVYNFQFDCHSTAIVVVKYTAVI
jgi:hypothetical protein